MIRDSLSRALIVLLVLAVAVPVWAASRTSTNFTLSSPAKLAGQQLDAGEYRLEVDGNKAVVKRNNKVVVETDCELVERDQKASRSAVVVSSGAIVEVRFGGKKTVAVFR